MKGPWELIDGQWFRVVEARGDERGLCFGWTIRVGPAVGAPGPHAQAIVRDLFEWGVA